MRKHTRRGAFLALVVTFLWSNGALALVSQIDGQIVPTEGNLQNPGHLQAVLNSVEGDPLTDPLGLDAVMDAAIFPQIFIPKGVVDFTDQAEDAGFENTFGWYNVGFPDEIFPIFLCDEEPPTTHSIDFPNSPNWLGGFIGFVLITPEGAPNGGCASTTNIGRLYYSETEINGDGDYVHSLVYSSNKTEDRFYFAFEDLFRGGDNDFDDMLIMVEGLNPPCAPEAEVCDEADNDCDGLTDEDTVDSGALCGEDEGECEPGIVICFEGDLVCNGGEGPTDEVCDGLDNDCDGLTDDKPADVGGACGENEGECEYGEWICVDGALACQGGVGPAAEVCDGLDNNCDGQTDEAPIDVGQVCGTGVGECEFGAIICVDGATICDGEIGPKDEICDGLDNDCDGYVDESDPGGGGVCGQTDVGECEFGIVHCIAGDLICVGAVLPSDEICDGLDNDCDGLTDEELVVECPGTSICVLGECAELCMGGEFDCPGGYACVEIDYQNVCVDDVCRPGSENAIPCADNPFYCDEGFTPPCECNVEFALCVDACFENDCPEGTVCVPGDNGSCVETGLNCYSDGCPEGLICVGAECVTDPCAGVTCKETEYCNGDGECVSPCIDVDCPDGWGCREGECVKDPCLGIICVPGFTCTEGTCERGNCWNVACKYYEVCEDGKCVDDPCWNIKCPNGLKCIGGACYDDEATGNSDTDTDSETTGDTDKDSVRENPDTNSIEDRGLSKVLATGPGGCLCTQAPGAGGHLSWGWMSLLLGAFLLVTCCAKKKGFLGICILIFLAACLAFGCDTKPYEFGSGDNWASGTDDTGHGSNASTDADGDTDSDSGTKCLPSVEGEVCNGQDDDCDGLTDEDVDFLSDPAHCGDCETVCEYPHAFSECAEGECKMTDCQSNYSDMDGDPSNGCEYGCIKTFGGVEACDNLDNDCDGLTDESFDLVDDPLNCGLCKRVCAFTNAEPLCAKSDCTMGVCFEGFHDVDLDPATGCEYACTLSNGGSEICDEKDNECNGVIDDGFDLLTDEQNCGICGVVCALPNAVMECIKAECTFIKCQEGYVNVSTTLLDGCEYACTKTNAGVEICDGEDNDCDATTDEMPADVGNPCGTTDEGECALGSIACVDGIPVCMGSIEPATEVCDDLDNNCDGQTDLPGCLVVVEEDVRLDLTSNAGAKNSIQPAIGANGLLIGAAWLDHRNNQADIYNACSSDGGATWTNDALVSSGATAGVKPQVLVDPGGSHPIYVLWEEFRTGNDRDIYLRRLESCGAPFSAETRLDSGNEDSLNIDVAADGSGHVYVVWEDILQSTGNPARNVHFAGSSDFGLTFGPAVRVNQQPSDPSLAYATRPEVTIGVDGRALVVWSDNRDDGAGDIYLNYSDDHGASFALQDIRLDDDGIGASPSKNPEIEADGEGNVYAIWQDFRNDSSDIYFACSSNDGEAFGGNVQVDLSSGATDAYEPGIALGPSGYVYLAWQDFRGGLPVAMVSSSSDHGVSFADPKTASFGDGFVEEVQIASNGEGKVFVAFIDDRNGFKDAFLNYSLDNGANFQPADLRMDVGSGPGLAEAFDVQLAAGEGGGGYTVWVDLRTNGVYGDIYFNQSGELLD